MKCSEDVLRKAKELVAVCQLENDERYSELMDSLPDAFNTLCNSPSHLKDSEESAIDIAQAFMAYWIVLSNSFDEACGK